MRRTTTLPALVLAFGLVAAACSDPATETATNDGIASSSTSAPPASTEAPTTTTAAAPATTESPSTTTAPDSTTTAAAPDDDVIVELYVEDEDEFCGDWIPARVGDNLTCRRPETLPPDPVARSTAWELPVVDTALVDRTGWHPPLALLNWDTVSLLTVDDPLSTPTVTPWARLHSWADELRVASDGTLVVAQEGPVGDEASWPWIDVAVYRPDGTAPSIVPDGQYLYDVGWYEGREVVVYQAQPTDDEDLPLLTIPLDDLASPAPAFGTAWGDEWLTTHVDLEDGWATVLGYLGNDSVIEFREPDGSLLDQPDPIIEHGHPDLDSVVAVAVSADGARVTWVEYPADLFDDPDEYVRVKSADLVTNDLIFDIPIEDPLIGPTSEPVVSVFDLGDHVIVNTVGYWANRWWPNPAIVVSFAGEEPDWWKLPVTGIAVPVPYTLS